MRAYVFLSRLLLHALLFMDNIYCILLCSSLYYLVNSFEGEKIISQSSNLKNEKTTSESIFKAAFLETRIHQLQAIQSVLRFHDYEKQYKLCYKALEKIHEVVSASKVIVENSNYIPGLALPVNITVYEALGKIIDNTAMFGEFRLKLPDISERIMNNHQDWLIQMKWAIGFSNSTGIFDEKTNKMIELLCQEMNLIPKSENFINPYRKYDSKIISDGTTNVPKQKKLKTKKGPRMSKIKNSEL